MSGIPAEFETPEGMRTLANYLRSQHGVKVRHGIEHEKRVDYFKGMSSYRHNHIGTWKLFPAHGAAVVDLHADPFGVFALFIFMLSFWRRIYGYV